MMFRGQEIKMDHFEPCIHRGSKRKIKCCGQWICRLHNTDCRLRRYEDAPNVLACNECDDKEVEYYAIDRTTQPIAKLPVALTAITSLNPNPHRLDRQLKCLQSWVTAGLSIVVVNTQSELNAMPWSGELAATVASCRTAERYDRQVQLVKSLIDVGITTGGQFMLINSDIEIAGDVSALSLAISLRDRLTICVRHNYDTGKETAARREPAGLDAFIMTPAMAETVVDIGLGIGKPGWDYWLPIHFRQQGIKFNWIQRPLFFHESHPIGWSDADWMRGHDEIKKHYGISISESGFRKGLPAW